MTDDTLFESTRAHVEKAMAEVTGDDDFLPIMVVRSHNGSLVAMGLVMPEESDEKNDMADVMTAICTVFRATEVAFTSNAWAVVKKDGEGEVPDCRPSESPDREEIAMISIIRREGPDSLHTAPIIRENNLAGVGMWEDFSQTYDGSLRSVGRLPDAIHWGIEMGAKIPPDMGRWLDGEIAEGRSEKLIVRMVEQMREVRKMRSKAVQN